MFVIPVMAILLAPALWLVLGRPRFLPQPNSNDKKAPVSIIIPARNEENNIARLLESIQAQSAQALETIVVNDGSTDGTARVATEHGARVIDVDSLPDGWLGKPWACQQGADAAHGQWLLFLDADLVLEPSALRAFSHLCANPDQVYSVCPYHVTRYAYEELSAFFNVLMLAGVNAFGLGSSRAGRAALFGQCLLVSKQHYQAVNGHHGVKDKTLENFHLSREFKNAGIPCSSFLGKGQVHMRMFPDGIGSLWNSWKKGFSGGAAHTAPRALLFSSLWISGMMLTIVCVALSFSSCPSNSFILLTAAAYMIHALQCLIAFSMAGTFSITNAVLFPISLLFYQILFFCSIIDKKRGKATEWKGRTVH